MIGNHQNNIVIKSITLTYSYIIKSCTNLLSMDVTFCSELLNYWLELVSSTNLGILQTLVDGTNILSKKGFIHQEEIYTTFFSIKPSIEIISVLLSYSFR